MRIVTLSVIAASLVISLPFYSLAAQLSSSPTSLAELATQKMASLARKDPGLHASLPKAKEYLRKLQQENPHSPYLPQLERYLDFVTYSTPSYGDTKVKLDTELVETINRPHHEPSYAELSELRERYAEFTKKLDEALLIKDLDRTLTVHDRFVRFTSLGLWNAEKISSELERLEELLSNAQDIPYGRAEALKGFHNRKLAAVPKLCNLGLLSREQEFLTTSRRSVSLLNETVTGYYGVEQAEHIMQGPQGELLDITRANHPFAGLPFCPPLSCWIKSRMLEGKVPAITFRSADQQIVDRYTQLSKQTGTPIQSVNLNGTGNTQDILEGKFDDYFKRNFQTIIAAKGAAIIGLFNNIDREPSYFAFGQDGHTPYYILQDAKLATVEPNKLQEELHKRFDKGSFALAKNIPEEMNKHYGDPAIPDGPERVRDALKRVKHIIDELHGINIGFYTACGAYHGNRTGAKAANETEAGIQNWNKLAYYYPGNQIIDWLGTKAVGPDPSLNAKGANFMQCISTFMDEANTSGWHTTPIMLTECSPGKEPLPFEESPWIVTLFTQILPITYPNISLVFLDAPAKLTLWTPEAMGSFRTHVSSNKHYKWPLRYKLLESANK